MDKKYRDEYFKLEEEYKLREQKMYEPLSTMNKVSLKSKKEQIKALTNMRSDTEKNIDDNFVEIIDIKTDLEEVEQFIKSNPVLLMLWDNIDTKNSNLTLKIENKNQTDLNHVIGNM